MNNKMILNNGQIIYPSYMSNEDKNKLKMFIANRSNVMYCGCKADVPDEEKLYYRLSADNKFIPLHKGYKHAVGCDRSSEKRSSAFITLDSSDDYIATYLRFNPLNFTPPVKQRKLAQEDENTNSNNEVISKEKKIKEPFLNLENLIRCINIDAYMERLIGKGIVLSRDYFLNAIKGRIKKVKVVGMDKSLGSLNYENDWCTFFYCKFIDLSKNEKGYWNLTLENNGKTFRIGIREEIAERQIEKFQKAYCGDLPYSDKSVMAAGFIYKRISKKMKEYYTVGRLHLFKTTYNEGVYCCDNVEKELYEIIFNYIKHRNTQARLYIPVEYTNYNCEIVTKKDRGKIYVGSPKHTSEEKAFNYSGDNATIEQLVKFIDSLLV